MKLYRTPEGWAVESQGKWHALPASPGLTLREDLYAHLASHLTKGDGTAAPAHILAPMENQEIWAAGVTYFLSREARMEESKSAGGGDFYSRVYNAARPELFFKATPSRVVGHGAAVRIRKDSAWNVPEPELALLVSPKGTILGYTIGNDMSSRDIEGENPLYLPQAKVYDACCALGPCVLISPEPLSAKTGISIEIRRAGSSVFQGSTSLEELKRRPAELVEYLFRDNVFVQGCFLLTGTGIVPPESFTLAAGDEIEISIEGIGVLINSVKQ